MSREDARLAIDAAARAFDKWKQESARTRAKVLRKWYDLLIANTGDLARIMTLECGKPLAESKSEVAYGASFIQWFSEEAPRLYGDVIPPFATTQRTLAMKQPVGVCGLITPWNFPIAMITRKAGAAFAAGCTAVLKPASETPLSALAIAALGEEAGIPAGVFNVVTSESGAATKALGEELTTNPKVRKISFTGSTGVGKILMKQAAGTMKRVSLELGGNAPFIVFEDADLDAAVEGCISSKFRNAGQTCVCVNRIYVQSSVYDAFASKLAARVKALKVGHGLDEGVKIGPLITSAGLEKVRRHVEDAIGGGAKAVVGGKAHERGGNFWEPTVLTGISSDAVVAQEETFGPLAALFRFETEEEVIRHANDTPYGLAGYFYSRDVSRIFRVAEALEVGMVGVNEGLISSETAPFGGVKESGMGREGSKYGIDEYVDVKYICLGVK
ncbi:hypothetical protein HDV00_004793 [Rhizophlyctis rosea]|nr:hypothetical protein HDV00_004793 [Rhizophlyctis rosea]